ncbi:hypothetical protein VNO78_33957 [Psophocarpus tetragonolobus]|uniref:Uncharacterized protein n=1 Tax=Psophocarpus tetragonolobus TaxID=3891 RepID=A0AAN9RLQ5_PSOTE
MCEEENEEQSKTTNAPTQSATKTTAISENPSKHKDAKTKLKKNMQMQQRETSVSNMFKVAYDSQSIQTHDIIGNKREKRGMSLVTNLKKEATLARNENGVS